MNQRIKELAVKAKLPDYLLEYGTELCVAPHLDKFAELIIRECAQVVENKTSALGYGVAELWCEPKDLFEHFGVE